MNNQPSSPNQPNQPNHSTGPNPGPDPDSTPATPPGSPSSDPNPTPATPPVADGHSSGPGFTSSSGFTSSLAPASGPNSAPAPTKPKKMRQETKAKLVAIITVACTALVACGLFALIQHLTNREEPKISPANPSAPAAVDSGDPSFSFLQLENRPENTVYSPLSIQYALRMLNDGTAGTTKSQITNLLGPAPAKYDNIANTLSLANALFVRDIFFNHIAPSYIDTLQANYDAELKADPFADATNINRWIEEKTLGQISNLVPDELIADPDSRLVLVNALAIDMAWQRSFTTDKTHGDSFYLHDGQEMTATTMSQEVGDESAAYYQGNGLTAVSMALKQYGDTQMEFIAIMPDGDLTNYVSSFNTATLNDIIGRLTPASKPKDGIIIKIPKFSYDYNLNLKSDLASLGVTDVFNPDLADLSPILQPGSPDLYISDALHSANIDFSEKGIRAAAGTAFLGAATSAQQVPQPIVIEINHPFLYVIRDKAHDEIWFVGTVYEPNAWADDQAEYKKG